MNERTAPDTEPTTVDVTAFARRVADLDVGEWPSRLQAAIEATRQDHLAALTRRDMLHPDAAIERLELPPVLLGMLAATLALDDADRARAAATDARPKSSGADQHDDTDDADDAHEMFAHHYTDWMPRILLDNLASTKATEARISHAPLDGAQLPRLTGAIDALAAMLSRVGADPARCLPAPSAETLFERFDTLARLYPQTHFGRCMPMLYRYPHDHAAYAQELGAGASVLDVVDRRLAGPLMHELAHLQTQRDALLPTYFEECVAGWFSIRSLPSLCWPEPGEDNGLFAAFWFGQVGQALCRAVGEDAVLRAHAGVDSWDRVLPSNLRRRLEDLGWRQHVAERPIHMLGETTRPEPWVKLIFLAAADDVDRLEPSGGWTRARLESLDMTAVGRGMPLDAEADAEVVADALRTAWSVVSRTETRAWRVSSQVPDAPISLDWRRGAMCGAQRGEGLAPALYFLPPPVCHRWLDDGVSGHRVRFDPDLEPARRDDLCHALAEAFVGGRGASMPEGVEVEAA